MAPSFIFSKYKIAQDFVNFQCGQYDLKLLQIFFKKIQRNKSFSKFIERLKKRLNLTNNQKKNFPKI